LLQALQRRQLLQRQLLQQLQTTVAQLPLQVMVLLQQLPLQTMVLQQLLLPMTVRRQMLRRRAQRPPSASSGAVQPAPHRRRLPPQSQSQGPRARRHACGVGTPARRRQ
jgi:hypothetical protein